MHEYDSSSSGSIPFIASTPLGCSSSSSASSSSSLQKPSKLRSLQSQTYAAARYVLVETKIEAIENWSLFAFNFKGAPCSLRVSYCPSPLHCCWREVKCVEVILLICMFSSTSGIFYWDAMNRVMLPPLWIGNGEVVWGHWKRYGDSSVQPRQGAIYHDGKICFFQIFMKVDELWVQAFPRGGNLFLPEFRSLVEAEVISNLKLFESHKSNILIICLCVATSHNFVSCL